MKQKAQIKIDSKLTDIEEAIQNSKCRRKFILVDEKTEDEVLIYNYVTLIDAKIFQ